ncbi:hypothetical protein B7494_g5169 [Chlorociboria aeruginascens]|nr:hypothetical protein B7494_g5169 [Chlorociboria aeruginascens]
MFHLTLVIALAISTLAPLVHTDCTRSDLQSTADAYLQSQSSGILSPIFNNASYRQNNAASTFTAGVLGTALKIDHNKTDIDTTSCATYTEVIVTNPSKPYVIGTQIHHNVGLNGTLTPALVDSVVSSTGDWAFNATQTLHYVVLEDWSLLPTANQSNYTYLQNAADQYLDLWSNASAVVPWGEPCDRLEGSAYTGTGSPTDSCDVGIPTASPSMNNTDRRYVVDVEMGTASVLCNFVSMGNIPDSHEFRLDNGKLRYVHTMTVMTASG